MKVLSQKQQIQRKSGGSRDFFLKIANQSAQVSFKKLCAHEGAELFAAALSAEAGRPILL